jgi:hypothetical protein
MSPGSNKPSSGDRDEDNDPGAGNTKTPSTDMQPEDAGTPDSGNSGGGNTGRGNAAESAMKQTSKTGKETGTKR